MRKGVPWDPPLGRRKMRKRRKTGPWIGCAADCGARVVRCPHRLGLALTPIRRARLRHLLLQASFPMRAENGERQKGRETLEKQKGWKGERKR